MHDSLTKVVVHLNDFEMFEVEMVDVLFVAGDFYRDPLEKDTTMRYPWTSLLTVLDPFLAISEDFNFKKFSRRNMPPDPPSWLTPTRSH